MNSEDLTTLIDAARSKLSIYKDPFRAVEAAMDESAWPDDDDTCLDDVVDLVLAEESKEKNRKKELAAAEKLFFDPNKKALQKQQSEWNSIVKGSSRGGVKTGPSTGEADMDDWQPSSTPDPNVVKEWNEILDKVSSIDARYIEMTR